MSLNAAEYKRMKRLRKRLNDNISDDELRELQGLINRFLWTPIKKSRKNKFCIA